MGKEREMIGGVCHRAIWVDRCSLEPVNGEHVPGKASLTEGICLASQWRKGKGKHFTHI